MDGWSAAEVARASGTPVAQLRAWERGGLLVPGVASDDGYRAYGRDDLVRLQRVLLLRALGVPDDGITAALASTDDAEDALRRHLDVLEGERDRLDRQAGALRATLAGHAVDPAAMFDGFDDPAPAPAEELAELGAAWARLWAAGEPVDGEAARALAGRHRALSGSELTPRLADALDHHAPGTAAYARDALATWGAASCAVRGPARRAHTWAPRGCGSPDLRVAHTLGRLAGAVLRGPARRAHTWAPRGCGSPGTCASGTHSSGSPVRFSGDLRATRRSEQIGAGAPAECVRRASVPVER